MAVDLVQFSTGLGSAEVARRVVAAHGVEHVHLLTADTLVEDEDNWRFAREVHEFLGKPAWTVLSDGRTPMQAGRDVRVVPNNRLAVCSRILKREIMRKHIDEHYDPLNTTIPQGTRLRHALMHPPYTHKQLLMKTWREDYGIEPPRLYDQGFGHANCGGACVRGGQAQWQRLLVVNRDRYLDWEDEEEKTRAELGKDVSILRDRRGKKTVPLTLQRFRERIEEDPTLFDPDDIGPCGCS